MLETVDIRSKNDEFIMSAARGDVKGFNKFLAMGTLILQGLLFYVLKAISPCRCCHIPYLVVL